ncbi:hypothetical protein FA15DRAFT_667885 [Coprinopsis marcescibilis]|nr:hypothetical protein FA15DRAFT_667885 [Coprinopsis marcescibilis]
MSERHAKSGNNERPLLHSAHLVLEDRRDELRRDRKEQKSRAAAATSIAEGKQPTDYNFNPLLREKLAQAAQNPPEKVPVRNGFYSSDIRMKAAESRPSWSGESHHGHIPGYPVGYTFKDRQELCDAGVHRAPWAGIHGDQENGAYSVVLSGGYEDDVDKGDEILYTGTGEADQSFDHPHNASLAKNVVNVMPVRVVRRVRNYDGTFGYRYDGLYRVAKCYMDKGVNGNNICRFELKRRSGQPPILTSLSFSPRR